MRHLILLALILTACDVPPPGREAPPANATDSATVRLTKFYALECREFDWHTKYRGEPQTCRLLWCDAGVGNDSRGGPTMLWCTGGTSARTEAP